MKNDKDLKKLLEDKRTKELISMEYLKAAHPIPSLDIQKIIALLKKSKSK